MALFRHVLARRRMRREYPAPQSALRSPGHIGRFLAVELDIEPAAAQSRGLGRVQLELAGNVAAGGFGMLRSKPGLPGTPVTGLIMICPSVALEGRPRKLPFTLMVLPSELI